MLDQTLRLFGIEPDADLNLWWEEANHKECGLHSQNVVRILG